MLRSIVLGALALTLLTSGSPGMSASQAPDPGVWQGTGPNAVISAFASCAIASVARCNFGPID